MTAVLINHPAVEIFPEMGEAEFAELVEDVRRHGLLTPIWLHPDGRIIDGRHRYRACCEAGVEPRTQTWLGEGSVVELIYSLNYHRRHLTNGAKQIAAGRYAIELEREARERVTANLPTVPFGTVVDAQQTAGRSRDKAAEKFGTSSRNVARAITVLKHGTSEDVKAVEQGTMAVTSVADRVQRQRSEVYDMTERKPPPKKFAKPPPEPPKPKGYEERVETQRMNGEIWRQLKAGLQALTTLPLARDVAKIAKPNVTRHNFDVIAKVRRARQYLNDLERDWNE